MCRITNLKLNKNEVLKAEIATLLFNLGKTHIGFWKDFFKTNNDDFEKQFGFQPFGKYKKYFEGDNSPFSVETSKIGNLYNFFNDTQIDISQLNLSEKKEFSLLDCMKAGNSKFEFIQKVMFRGCENINSGIDKGALPEGQQIKEKLYISNAFGSFKKEIDKYNLDERRICFFHCLNEKLKTKPDWTEIRNFIFEKIKSWYSNLLSDSRFPANDVSLWDQVFMTASMFKATLSGLYMGNKKDVNKYIKNPQSIKWQILGIQYDKLGLAEKGNKPALIQYYRDKSKEIDDCVKKYLEEEIALGNEIYRDETGVYFLVPEGLGEENNKNDDDFKKLNIEKLDSSYKEIQKEINLTFYKSLNYEVQPVYFLTKASRGTMNLTNLISKAKELFLYSPQFKTEEKKTKEEHAKQLCRACRIELAVEKKEEQEVHLCGICKKRKEGRIDKWIESLNDETIWLDDLQDKNSRIALVTLRFELEEWLNGNMLSTMVNQKIESEKNFNKESQALKNELEQSQKTKKISKTIIGKYRGDISNISIEDFINRVFLERSIGDNWENFLSNIFEKKINVSEKKINWKEFEDKDYEILSLILLQFLLRKNPSPARLYRIWKTTQQFTQDIRDLIFSKVESNRWVFNLKNKGDKGEYESGIVKFWVKDKKAYLITNLKIADKLLQDEFEIKQIVENNQQPNKIKLNKNDAKFCAYHQIFSIIDPTPISWQFAIPANKVNEIIKIIQNKYKEEFHYVYGKLPLHIGIIVQNYKAPLYIGLNALRNIRRELKWKDIETKLDGDSLKLIQKDVFKKAKYDTLCNDAESYYSYYIRADEKEGSYKFYFPSYNKNNKEQFSLSLTKDSSKADDKFKFYPNTIDFEYLDSNSRRNDIFYRETKENQNKERNEKDKGKRIPGHRKHRPYIWEEWESFLIFKELFVDKNIFSYSQIHNLVSLFYKLLQDWKENPESIQKLAGSAVINILKLKSLEKDKQNKIFFLFGCENLSEIKEKIEIDKIEQFLDMFDYRFTSLKERDEKEKIK